MTPSTTSELYAFALRVQEMMRKQQAFFAARARKETGERELSLAKQEEAKIRREIKDIERRATVTPSFPTMDEAERRLR